MWRGLLLLLLVEEVEEEVVGLNNYESGSLTFWGVNLKSMGTGEWDSLFPWGAPNAIVREWRDQDTQQYRVC